MGVTYHICAEVKGSRYIREEYLANENIILDITNLNKEDLAKLYKELGAQLTDNEILKTVVVNVCDSSMSKNATELFKFLRG